MALKLSLKPDEKLVINGAVIANADRRTTLIVHNKASILREKDIMQEDEVDTPARRIYFPIMLMYMDQQKTDTYYEEFMKRMTEFMAVITTPEAINLCVKISKDVMEKNFYRALMNCKKLLAFETSRLNMQE
ncbi:flagellar biosynthesis repressor FlbT [Kordiimonas sp. SCSIO 12603]|uniref:flagellar biosynthesis repressor FlbT n=1 Tax=Kordiimonas sp. SCSIO 12603 TaxID=2829596 RepID=UPI002107898A|nr:flagellar biosynthesis repressor FlbT [Kordiimonas sp. SCSIO 12603]UTW57630.1 flagellar biosynthesis repressor FlbT [Kordiimonas sp. SCSIO 12603]